MTTMYVDWCPEGGRGGERWGEGGGVAYSKVHKQSGHRGPWWRNGRQRHLVWSCVRSTRSAWSRLESHTPASSPWKSCFCWCCPCLRWGSSYWVVGHNTQVCSQLPGRCQSDGVVQVPVRCPVLCAISPRCRQSWASFPGCTQLSCCRLLSSRKTPCPGLAVSRKKAKRLKKAVKRLKGCYHLVAAFWPKIITLSEPQF